MNTALSTQTTSPLDASPVRFADQPFYDETLTLLRSTRDHDFDALAQLCDDDFGIVGIGPSGTPRPIRSRKEWEDWFSSLFSALRAVNADTDTTILDYKAVRSGPFGFSALEYRQTLALEGLVASFECIATIVWKLTPDGWREARWHASVISSDVPEALMASAAA